MKVIVVKCFLLFLCLLVCSCKPNWKDASWDVDMAMPLVRAKLDLSKIVNDTLLMEDADHSLSLVYRSSLYNINIDSILKMPDTTVASGYNVLFPYTFNPGQQIYTNTQNTKYNISGAEISWIDFKEGIIRIKITSSIKERLVLKLTMPCASKNGAVFDVTDIIPAATVSGASVLPTVFQKDYDISGYTLNLKGQNNNSVNTIYYVTNITVHPDANPVSVNTSDYLHIENSFKSFKPSYVKGYFGMQQMTYGPDYNNLGLFNIVKSGFLKLEEAKLILNIKNGIGADGSIKIKELSSLNNRTSATATLNHYLINSWININRAFEDFSSASPLNYTYKSFSIDKTNSNIKNLLEILPDQLKYDLEIKLNPQGNVSAGNDFLYADHTIETNMDLRIPLKFAMSEITLIDTARIDIDTDKNRIRSGTFNLVAINKFPFETKLQLYLLNELNQVSDSVFSEGNRAIQMAQVNANNEVLAPQSSTISFVLNEEKMQRFINTKKFLVKAVLNTNSYPVITTLYSDCSLDIRLTGDFHATLGKLK